MLYLSPLPEDYTFKHTYPHGLGIIPELVEPLKHRLPVLLPLSLTEHDLQEVPGPADQRNFQQLVFRQHLGALG